MNNELKNWLSRNNIALDNYGRIIIHDEKVISEISGAVGKLQELPETCCGGGCDAGCHGCEALNNLFEQK
ncbi:TPA: hypothetical protein DIC20_01680 [Candidatus Dependentiae bacterium]|nr:hypothetical protein [Candidatus Dependentiae bacterium]